MVLFSAGTNSRSLGVRLGSVDGPGIKRKNVILNLVVPNAVVRATMIPGSVLENGAYAPSITGPKKRLCIALCNCNRSGPSYGG